MNKTSLTALQFFSNFYQKVENISDIFAELAVDKRFPESLRQDFAAAGLDVDYCFTVILNAIDFVRTNDLPAHGNENIDKTDGKPRN